MCITKNLRHQVDQIVHQRELHPGDTCEIFRDIDSRIENVGVNLVEVACRHGNRGLTPSMGHLNRRVGDSIKTNQPEQEYEPDNTRQLSHFNRVQ